MKVNIKGRGIVPRVNQLAPVYNVDLGKNDIQFLLNFNNLKVYETKSGLLIRPDTIDEMFAKSQASWHNPRSCQRHRGCCRSLSAIRDGTR